MRQPLSLACIAFVFVFVNVPAHAETGVESGAITMPSEQTLNSVVADGSGGHYIAFLQPKIDRNVEYPELFVQRVGGSGSWSAPVRVSPGAGTAMGGTVRRTPSGAIVVFTVMTDATRLHVQRLSTNGAPMWPSAKQVPVSIRRISNVDAIGDGAYVAFHTPNPGNDRYALMRIDESGGVLWSNLDLGTDAATGRGDFRSALCVTPNGDAIVVVPGAQVVAYKFSPSGGASWGSTGILITRVSSTKQGVAVACDERGGANIGWLDSRDGESAYSQRIDAQGKVAWAENGVQVATGTAPVGTTGTQSGFSQLAIASDGAGGAFLGFFRNVAVPPSTFKLARPVAAHLKADGTFAFGSGGGLPLDPAYRGRELRVAADGKGGAFFSWQSDTPYSGSVKPQCLGMRWLDGAGTNAWGPEAARTGRCNEYPAGQIWSVGDGNVASFWTDPRAGHKDIFRWSTASPGARLAPLASAPAPRPSTMPTMTVPAPTPTPTSLKGLTPSPTTLPTLQKK